MKRVQYHYGVTRSAEETVEFIYLQQTHLEPYGDGSPRSPRFDWADALGTSDHVYARTGEGEMVGFATIQYQSPAVGRLEGTASGLGLARDYEDTVIAGLAAAQVRHLVVDPAHRGTAAAGILVDGVLDRLAARGVTMALGLASLDTNLPIHATVAVLAAQAQGLWHPTLYLRARRPALAPRGEPLVLYPPEQMEAAFRGGLGRARLPAPLNLYRRFNSVICGEPVPYGDRGIFVVPVACPTRPAQMVPPDPPGGATTWRSAA